MAKRISTKKPLAMMAKAEKSKSGKLKGKTIVQILPALNHGGVERGTVEMAEAIINAGGRAIVISSGGALESQLSRLGAEHIKLSIEAKSPFRIMQNRRRLKKLFTSLKPDLVHIRSRAPAWSGLTVAKKLGIPVVTTIHGRLQTTSVLKKIYNRIMVEADHVIVISHYIEGLVLQQFPHVASKISVIHRGVDLNLFNPKTISAHRMIKMSELLVIPDDVTVIMLPARPTTWKGMAILIKAMRLIRDENFLLCLVGAGDGSEDFQNQLIREIKKADLMEKVRLTPFISDMPAGLMLADVVVMPSIKPEPFGRVAVEASAMGCPVVAFNHGGATESIIDGVTGWLAKPNDLQSLADAISLALNLKKHARKKLAVEARHYVEEKFSSDVMCRSTINLYNKLL